MMNTENEVQMNSTQTHVSWPSIGQFRNVIRNVQHSVQYEGQDSDGNTIMNRHAKMPVLKFKGSVKIHGTNAGVVFNSKTGEIWAQSRENIITPFKDNAGFAMFVESIRDNFVQAFKIMNVAADLVIIFGEWAGKGVQSGVAVSEIEKSFFIFGVDAVVDGKRIHLDEAFCELACTLINQRNVFNINDFKTFYLNIDFEHPEIAQNQLVELTESVEKECPVGHHFGVSGVGEGIVWRCLDPSFNDSGFWFKVKGEKHSVSKVKTIAAIDIEKMNSINDLVNSLACENRLEQIAQQVFNTLNGGEFDIRKMGDFIKAVSTDIWKEEKDTILASGFNMKEISGPIAKNCRDWSRTRFGV